MNQTEAGTGLRQALLWLALLGLWLAMVLPAQAWTQADLNPTKIREQIKEGDPLVVPLLRDILQAAARKERVDEDSELTRLSLYGLGRFGDTESLPLMEWAYERSKVHGAIRYAAALAIADVGGEAAEKTLKRIVWDQRLPHNVRCHAAAALVRLDSDHAREFLLLQYDVSRLEHRMMSGQSMGAERKELQALGDAKLIAALKQRLAVEPKGTMYNNIRTLLEPMEVLAQPMDVWKTFAENTDFAKDANQRYLSIQALGEHGDPSLVPFLQGLKPWDGKVIVIQQNFVKDHVAEAIARIRQRHWPTYLAELQDGAPPPEGADAAPKPAGEGADGAEGEAVEAAPKEEAPAAPAPKEPAPKEAPAWVW